MMQDKYKKADRKLVRNLAGVAWERQLRDELNDIGCAIAEMQSGNLSPFDVNERVHQFHNGIAQELYNLYSGSDPWLSVCRAHFNGVLTDADLVDASDSVREGLQQFAQRIQEYNGI
ncbi:hypothetical protein [Rhodopirellula sp. MGV]|uniref:hypothetical protein n=1 Tax=Rhodopirellula sp. MGV TaxID=2023130 RepID=UPI000B962A94|nr:hypothetical protein [Rhodopirellula sp. MGV]OYP34319.1 hypothetical protein CGZ80_14740 [Rhodopirellula sp. MGV]PNY36080.1 hypothetical protein C2E31_14885 [Rhodopirellula baltica]